MKFKLTDKLKKRMTEKNVGGILLQSQVKSCWSGSYAEVSAKFTDTPKGVDFDTYDVDGFKVFVQKGIEANKDIVTIDLGKLLFIERILVNGIKQF